MTDVLMRRVVNIVERVEAALQTSLTAAARAREDCKTSVDAIKARAGEEIARANDAEALEVRYAKSRMLDLRKINQSMPSSPAEPRPFPADPQVARTEYKRLAEATKRTVRELVQAHWNWDQKNGIARLAKRSSKPEPPSPSLVQDVVTVLDWAPRVAADERATITARRDRAIADQQSELAAMLRRLDASRAEIGQATEELEAIQHSVPVTASGWEDPRWGADARAESLRGELRIGEFELKAPRSLNLPPAPATIAFPFTSSLVVDGSGANRSAAIELARSLCARMLATVPPGKLRFTFVDPVAIGQSVAEFQHLSDYNQEIVDTRPATTARDIETRLQNLAIHIETVISKYLRGQFDTIDEYNALAGEVAEPYRLLVVFDYPAGFSENAAQQLLSLIENGPRCGLHTIVVADEAREQPRDLSLDRLRQNCQLITWQGHPARARYRGSLGEVPHPIIPDPAPPITFDPTGRPVSPVAELLAAFGEGVRQAGSAAVTLDRLLPVFARTLESNRLPNLPTTRPGAPTLSLDPQTWWPGSTQHAAVAPIGRSGAQDVTSLYFSSTEIAGGAIMVGLPRSGKSTSLHAAILTMCMLYPPDELELYLIDNKHGVEFKAYEHLPHARMVSINSEREFSVAVLKSIDSEIQRRADVMKTRAAGSANITEFREATGEKLPRIVVVMDEFHEVFEEDDRVGHDAFQAFSNIVRQGPFAGVHMVVASQTLSSMPALDRSTLQLLPERIAFMCNESDADIVMGDDNRGTRLLSKQGEGLFNPARGEPSQNRPFQGLFVPGNQRAALITELRAKAEQCGWTRHPRVFDGDAAATRSATPSEPDGSTRITVPLGEPFSLAAHESVTLRRTRGSNVVLVGDLDDPAADLSVRAAVHSFIRATRESGADVTLIDFIGDEEIRGAPTAMEVAQALGARYVRSRGAAEVLGNLQRAVETRLAEEDYPAPARVVVLFGVQRALSLRPADPYSFDESLAASESAMLGQVVKDGPEVGIHTVLSADSVKSVERRLGTDLLAEFTVRIAGSNATPADLQFASGTYSDTPALGRHQLLIGDQLTGTTSRVRGYLPLSANELGERRSNDAS